MRKDEQLDYEQMKQKALEQLRSGKSLYGKDGAFAPLLHFLWYHYHRTPSDRSSTFEPGLIRKRETILAESLEHKIIGMYGLGWI